MKKQYFIKICLILTFCMPYLAGILFAQTTIINPAVSTNPNGSFENATSTFAANGWIEVNGSQTNKWYVGTAAFNAGSKGAYVGTASGNNNYTNTTASVVMFYRDVSFPAGETIITLSFKWKGDGESCCDRLRVFLVPTSTTLTAGTELSSGQIGVDYNLQTIWQTANITIPESNAGTTQRLVFSWRNDGSLGNSPAAAVDVISLTSASCTVQTIPYSESFESITVANTLPSCMASTNLSTNTYTYISNPGSYNRIPRTGTDFASFDYSCNDWFFTHGLSLTSGVTYEFSFWYVTDGYSGWTTLDAFFGNAQNLGAMTTAITGATVSGPTNTSYVQMIGTFTPSSTGTFYCGIHCLAGGAPYYLSIDDINVVTACSSPSSQATSFTSSAVATTTMTVGWTRGNGNNIMVVAKSGSAPTDPVKGTSYTANAAYGSGTPVGGGFCVYNGTGTSVNLTALTANTTYYFAIYEYNTTGICYNLTELSGNVSTCPTVVTVPQTCNFTSYTGANLTTLFPNFSEAAGTTPSGTTSGWTNSTALGAQATAKINLYTTTTNEWIVGPTFTVSNSAIDFKAAITDYNSGSVDPSGMQGTDDKVIVKVKTCGGTWSDLYTFQSSNTTSLTNSLTQYTLDLSAYNGQTITIAFYASDGPVDDSPDYDFHIDDINIYTSSGMTYTSSTSTQTNTSSVITGSTSQEIIGIQIVTTGSSSPLSATSFTVNANGTTAIADINTANSAKIYYTGTSSTFATTTLFGQNTPTISNFNITGSQTLSTGTNYFWLVYDIKSTATPGNVVDGECTSLTVTSARTPTVTAPAGNRQIIDQVTIGTGTSNSEYYPYTSYYAYGRTASIYTAAEVGNLPTLITTLGWDISSATTDNVPIKIYLKTTTASTVATDTWSNMIAGATLVYDNTVQFTPNGWKSIDITDFSYCGDNLMVLCESNNVSSPYTYTYFDYTSTGSYQNEYWSNSSTPPTGTGTTSYNRPNIQINKGIASGMAFTS